MSLMTFITHDQAALDAVLAGFGAEQRACWRTQRKHYQPKIYLLSEDDRPVAAALTSGRPSTSYRKIVDVWLAEGADHVLADILDAVILAEHESEIAAVKVEIHPWAAAQYDRHSSVWSEKGFEPLSSPIISAAGTDGGVAGLVRWRQPWQHPELPYYGQTTEFTCGSVATLMILENLGAVTLAEHDRTQNRRLEMSLWRQATNFPGCDPVGLGVATFGMLQSDQPHGTAAVYLSEDKPVLLEEISEPEEREWRALLQREFRQEAEHRGLPIHTEWVDISRIAEWVVQGNYAITLIDEIPMHNDKVAHWILVHRERDGVFLAQDPWIDATNGETWVDAHDLPLTADQLDGMARYGNPAYRGVILVSPDRS